MQTTIRATIALLFTILLAAPPTHAQDAVTPQVRVNGYAQIQFNTTSIDDAALGTDDFATSTFETRRVRIFVDVALNEWLSGRIQPEWSMGNFRLVDVYMNFNIAPRFQLRAGQFKRPFSRFFLIGAPQHLAIEQGVRIREFDRAMALGLTGANHPFTEVNGGLIHGTEQDLLGTMGLTGHDMGLAAHGKLGRISYNLSLLNGTGHDRRDNNDGKSVMTRISYAPLTDLPLTLSAAASYRESYFNGTIDGTASAGRTLNATTLGFDLEWGRYRAEGVKFLAGIITGDNLYIDTRIFGAHGVFAYNQPLGGTRVEALEFVGRASYGDPNTRRSGDHGILLTPGINLYFSDNNRLSLNWDTYLSGSDHVATAHALRIQSQFAFGVPIPGTSTVASGGGQE